MAHWLGPGVYTDTRRNEKGELVHKDYHVGDELPKDINKDVLKSLIAKGKATDKAIVGPAAQDGEVVGLKKQVTDLTAALKAKDEELTAALKAKDEELTAALKAKDEELTAAQTKINELTGQLEQANQIVAGLTSSTTAGPAAGKAEKK